MKKIFTTMIMVLAVAVAIAQAPVKFTYQAVVRNANNSLMANASVGIRVSVLQGSATGNAVYVESHTATTNANGLLTVEIGGGTAQQGTFADIDWANGPYFLKTETDPNGGTNYSVTSTQQLLSVPYALYAKDAGNIPTIPANVSAFANDAGYITAQEIPEIPTVPTNVSAFTNDAGYLTNFTEQQVLSISNDTIFLTGGSFVKLPEAAVGFSGDYNDLINTPTIPTNVSAFTNDAGYLTSYTETDPNVPAWAKEATKPSYDYSEIANTPVIPTVPTNVSAFENDVPYLTSFTEQQVLSISNDTIFLTGGSFVKLPVGFSGDYNDLTNKPEIPEIPTVPDNVSAFTNDAGYITMDSVPTIPVEVSAFNNDAQYVSNAECADVDLCALANALSQLQALVEEQQSRIEELESLIGASDTTTPPIDTTTVTPTDTTSVTDGIPCPNAATVTDIDGNVYNTVQIGNQCWMRDNLRTTHYSDGTAIAAGSSSSTTVAYYYTPGGSFNYGYLYNWKAVMRNSLSSQANPSGVQGICPTGWHVPSKSEWTELTQYVGSQSEYQCDDTASYIAKALASNIGWYSSTYTCAVGNTPSSNNATGFSALSAGYYAGDYYNFGSTGYFWSSSVKTDGGEYFNGPYRISLAFNSAELFILPSGYDHGFSVRCACDEIGGGTVQTQPTVTTGEATDITFNSATLNGTVSNSDNVTITAQGFEWKTAVNDNYTTVDASGEIMSYNLTGLADNTSYSYRAFVTTAEGTNYGEEVSFTTSNSSIVVDSKSCPAAPTVTDHEGNVYATVQIGGQCWMRDNLRTTTSPSTGTYLIPADSTSYTNTGKQARWYNNDSTTYAPLNYGLLYNWNAAVDTFNAAYGETSVNQDYSNAVTVSFAGNRRGICPAGWHLPSDAEWTTLTDYVSSQNQYVCGSDSSYIAKSLASTEGWNTSTSTYINTCVVGNDQSANNATGFSAVPAGCNYSSFYRSGYFAYIWSSTEYSQYNAFHFYLGHHYADVGNLINGKYYGCSVRCLLD